METERQIDQANDRFAAAAAERMHLAERSTHRRPAPHGDGGGDRFNDSGARPKLCNFLRIVLTRCDVDGAAAAIAAKLKKLEIRQAK